MNEKTEILEKSNQSRKFISYALILLTFILALFLSSQNDGPSKFPKVVIEEFKFTAWVNDGEDYLKKNYRWITKIIANYINQIKRLSIYPSLIYFLLDIL